MTPILLKEVFSSNDPPELTSWEKIGFLSESINCLVTEARNGEYNLTLEYPVTGAYFSELQENLLIKAKPNNKSDNQYFRITEITKPLDGVVTIYANHISYDLAGYPVKNYSASSVTAAFAISMILSNSSSTIGIVNPFSFGSCDIATTTNINFKAVSARAALGGSEGSVLDLYGGEFEFDNYSVKLHKNRGQDNGVRISYGKNLVGLNMSIKTENSYTGVFPYVYDNETLVVLPESTIFVTNSSGVAEKIMLLDCSQLFGDEEAKTVNNLRQHAQNYLNTHDINAVDCSMTVEMVDLSKSAKNTERDIYAKLEEINLCDTVKVIHPNLGISVKLKVVKTIYNVLSEKYEKLELGSIRPNFADTITQATQPLKKTSTGKSALLEEYDRTISEATRAITGASGGYVVLNPSLNPQEIRILCDTPDIQTSQKYWQWNSQGLRFTPGGGVSSFALLGDDGKLIINDITARQISADLIRTGTITSVDGDMVFNLNDGTIVNTYSDGGRESETIIATAQLLLSQTYGNNIYRLNLGALGTTYTYNTVNASVMMIANYLYVGSSQSNIQFQMNGSNAMFTGDLKGNNSSVFFHEYWLSDGLYDAQLATYIDSDIQLGNASNINYLNFISATGFNFNLQGNNRFEIKKDTDGNTWVAISNLPYRAQTAQGNLHPVYWDDRTGTLCI